MTRLQGEIVRRIDAMQESYERGRADERAKNVALLRELADKALKAAERHNTAGRSREGVSLLITSAEAFETAAFAIDAVDSSSEPRCGGQDARSASEGTPGGSEAESASGGAFAGDFLE